MSTPIEETIDRLLHDAEHAMSGADMAHMMVGRIASAASDAMKLHAKADRLIAEAHAADPHHVASAWQETDLKSLPAPTP